MNSLLAATAFLTRVPVPGYASADDVRHATQWFPVIGAAIGLTGAALAEGLSRAPGVPPTLVALLLVTFSAWITGAIHLDGLADTADGFGGGRTKEDVLRIMRDPRVGSFGALALILCIGLRVSALASLLERHAALPFLIVAPTLSRWTAVALGWWLPYTRPEGGLGEAVTGSRHRIGVAVATAIAAAITALATGVIGALLLGIAVLATAAIGTRARRRIGGVTGDVLGASVEITETIVLAAAVFIA